MDIATLRAVAARSNVTISPQDEEHYRYVLDAFDATASQVSELPAYDLPHAELQPAPETLPRKYWKEPTNPLNAWSHRTSITHPSPSSTLLEGRSVAVKDNISVAGVPITGGTFPEILTGTDSYHTSSVDAVVVSRLLRAGATIAGTATCEHLSLTPMSYTSASGPVHNPWRKGFTAGGSSSGPGALVGAAQMRDWRGRHGLPALDEGKLGPTVDMAIGGDQGGSIRIPAAYNGIYGLKPTHGLIPYTGILSLVPMIDHTGPLCRRLEDVAALLKVLAGWDGIDPRMTPDSPRRSEVKDYPQLLADFIADKERRGEWTRTSAGKGLRVGVIKESFSALGLTSEVKTIVQSAFQRFRDIGAAVEEVSIPIHLIGPSIWTIAVRPAMAQHGFSNQPLPLLNYTVPGFEPPPFDQSAYEMLTKFNPAVVSAHLTQSFLAHDREASLPGKAISHVYQLRQAYDDALSKFDVLVTPLNPTTGVPHPGPEDTVRQKAELAAGATSNTCQFNITGRKWWIAEPVASSC